MINHNNIASYDPTTLRFFSRWEEFEDIRHPEDGEMIFGKVAYVVAEAENGARFYRQIGILNHRIETVEDDGFSDLVVVRTADWDLILTVANQLASDLEALSSPRLNPEVWGFAGAAYGSELYQYLEDNNLLLY